MRSTVGDDVASETVGNVTCCVAEHSHMQCSRNEMAQTLRIEDAHAHLLCGVFVPVHFCCIACESAQHHAGHSCCCLFCLGMTYETPIIVQIMVPGRTNVSLTFSWSTDYDPISAAEQPGAAKQGPKGDADSEVSCCLFDCLSNSLC